MSERSEKSWTSVLLSIRNHHNVQADEGYINGSRVRWTVAEQIAQGKELTKPISEGGKGLSKRKAAKLLGVAESTLRGNLKKKRGNRAPNARKPRTVAKRYAGEPGGIWLYNLECECLDAIGLIENWNNQFGNWSGFAITDEVLSLVESAVATWGKIQRTVSEKKHVKISAPKNSNSLRVL